MAAPSVALAGTSIFIAQEAGRPLAELPDHLLASVITLGELSLGVLLAPDRDARARRAQTLRNASAADPLPVTESIMLAWARLNASCVEAGIRRFVRLTDSIIAATAIEHGLSVVTQDEKYDRIAKAHPELTVIKV